MRLPFNRLFSQILGFLFVVSSTLFANWLWQKYTNEIDFKNAQAEERQHFISIVHRVLEESDYNGASGIGDPKCPFKLEAHHELLGATLCQCLSKNSIELAREIVRMGSLCNGGRTSRQVTPALVKAKSAELKDDLQKLLVADNSK